MYVYFNEWSSNRVLIMYCMYVCMYYVNRFLEKQIDTL